MTTQEGLPSLATDAEIAELKSGLDGVTPGPWHLEPSRDRGWSIRSGMYSIGEIFDNNGFRTNKLNAAHLTRLDPDRIRAVLARLEAAERQVKALRKDLTFVGDMAVYALKTDDDDTSGILATIRDTSHAALEAKSHDD